MTSQQLHIGWMSEVNFAIIFLLSSSVSVHKPPNVPMTRVNVVRLCRKHDFGVDEPVGCACSPDISAEVDLNTPKLSSRTSFAWCAVLETFVPFITRSSRQSGKLQQIVYYPLVPLHVMRSCWKFDSGLFRVLTGLLQGKITPSVPETWVSLLLVKHPQKLERWDERAGSSMSEIHEREKYGPFERSSLLQIFVVGVVNCFTVLEICKLLAPVDQVKWN